MTAERNSRAATAASYTAQGSTNPKHHEAAEAAHREAMKAHGAAKIAGKPELAAWHRAKEKDHERAAGKHRAEMERLNASKPKKQRPLKEGTRVVVGRGGPSATVHTVHSGGRFTVRMDDDNTLQGYDRDELIHMQDNAEAVTARMQEAAEKPKNPRSETGWAERDAAENERMVGDARLRALDRRRASHGFPPLGPPTKPKKSAEILFETGDRVVWANGKEPDKYMLVVDCEKGWAVVQHQEKGVAPHLRQKQVVNTSDIKLYGGK